LLALKSDRRKDLLITARIRQRVNRTNLTAFPPDNIGTDLLTKIITPGIALR